MGRRAREIAVVATVVVLGAVGVGSCGDEDRLSKKEFVARADAVCAESDKKLQNAFREELSGPAPPTAKQMQAALKSVVPITERTVAALKKLEPPEDLEARFDDALIEAELAIATLRKGATSATEAQAVFSAPEDPFQKTNTGLESVGITACSQGGGDAAGVSGVNATGVAAVSFSATEYSFAGPRTMKAGKVNITLANKGKERHEMNIVRLKDGVTAQQVVDAEAAGRDTGDLVADDSVGAVGPVEPGATGAAALDLVPGTYGYACFVDAPDGEPHVAKGMLGQFKVR